MDLAKLLVIFVLALRLGDQIYHCQQMKKRKILRFFKAMLNSWQFLKT